METIEEKARRYDEAIEQLRKMMPNWDNLSYNGKTFIQDLVHILPELKESEDERIRKDIMDFLRKGIDGSSFEDVKEKYRTWISWLEKQNQNLEKLKLEKGKWYFCIEDYHPRADCTDFYQGEKYRCEKDGVMGVWWIKNPEKYFRECKTPTYADSDSVRIQSIIQVLAYARSLSAYNQFGKDDITKDIAWLEKQGEQKPTDKVEPKFKVGDTVIVKPMSCHGKVFKGEPFKIVDIIEDNYVSNDGKTYSISLQDGWELVQQNPAWSEEDEIKVKSIIAFLKSPSLCIMDGNKGIIDENIKYLKSIKDRIQPKQ